MRNSINDLPVEHLIDIMKYLDQRSLKAAILTCQRWKNIVENHCFWSIRIDDRELSYLTVRHLQETNRKIKIELYVYHKLANEISIYQQIGFAVTELIWDFDRHSTCLEYLKYFPNLECMKVSNLEALAIPDELGVHDLKKLKSLKTINCSHNIYKYFGTSNIKSLEINYMSVNSQCVANFIRRQKSLKKLRLIAAKDGSTFFQQLCHATPNGTVPFKLSHLLIVGRIPLNNNIGLEKFIRMQSETLRKLRLDGEFSYSILKIICEELKNLKFLAIRMINEIEFGETLKENWSIENLAIMENNFSPLALSQLCKRLPNVRNLCFIERCNHELLRFFSTSLNNVTTLCVHNFDRNFEMIKFPNLTSIFIANVFAFDFNWTAFCRANSGITEMVIERCCNNLSRHIYEITRNLKLQTLKIGEGFFTDESFLSIIRNNCPELKVLELLKSCGIRDLRRIYESGIPFRFCNEIKISNEIRFWNL